MHRATTTSFRFVRVVGRYRVRTPAAKRTLGVSAVLAGCLREAGRVVPRERLVNAVLSRKFSPFDRSIDMHVSKVRKKLGDTDSDEHIKTVRGVGYIFARPRETKTGTP